MKHQPDEFEPLGLSLRIKVPKGVSVSVISVITPLLDGIIFAFHTHKYIDVSVATHRLSSKMDVDTNELDRLLKIKTQAVLGSVDLIQPYRNFVKWNPADERLVLIDIKLEESTDNLWRHDGELFKLKKRSTFV